MRISVSFSELSDWSKALSSILSFRVETGHHPQLSISSLPSPKSSRVTKSCRVSNSLGFGENALSNKFLLYNIDPGHALHLQASLFLNHRRDITRDFLIVGPYIPMIILAVLWTFLSFVQACVQGNVRYPVWLVYCGEEGRKCSMSTELGTVTNKRCVILDEKSL